MKNIVLLFASLFISNAAFAGSVNWLLEDMTLQVYAENFNVQEAEVQMECKIADGSELISVFPNKVLKTELSVDESFAGEGNWYTLKITGARLWSFVPFADVNYCSVELSIVSDVLEDIPGGQTAVYTEVYLAGAGYDEVAEFTNSDVAALIEERFSNGIKLKENSLVIEQY